MHFALLVIQRCPGMQPKVVQTHAGCVLGMHHRQQDPLLSALTPQLNNCMQGVKPSASAYSAYTDCGARRSRSHGQIMAMGWSCPCRHAPALPTIHPWQLSCVLVTGYSSSFAHCTAPSLAYVCDQCVQQLTQQGCTGQRPQRRAARHGEPQRGESRPRAGPVRHQPGGGAGHPGHRGCPAGHQVSWLCAHLITVEQARLAACHPLLALCCLRHAEQSQCWYGCCALC